MSLHIINKVIDVNSNVLCYGIIIFIGKELFYKHGWRKGGQTWQLLNRPTMIYYLALNVVLTFGGISFYGPDFIQIIPVIHSN